MLPPPTAVVGGVIVVDSFAVAPLASLM